MKPIDLCFAAMLSSSMADLSSQPITIQNLYSWYTEGRIFVNRRYQRKLVWTLEEKQRLVESILHLYPIPAIIIAGREEPENSFEVIDGLQRIHAIVSFVENAFPTIENKYFNVGEFPTASDREEDGYFNSKNTDELIARKEVSSFLNYTIAVSVMRNATEAEINDVFDRINTYGRRLSDQERRQSGTEHDFSSIVRKIACSIRGDMSDAILPLEKMPSISIDLPKTNHGYEVKADSVFWVQQGVLRATDLRDSMDEQCIADITACIVGGTEIERSKDALDKIYDPATVESKNMMNSLDVFGSERFHDEFKYCIEQIVRVVQASDHSKLRSILFKQKNTNPFPSVFATVFIAMYELLIKENKEICNYKGIADGLLGAASRMETSRSATNPIERRKNIDSVKGVISSNFEPRISALKIYGMHTSIDIDSLIRRSSIELPNYELKQGVVTLSDRGRSIDENAVEKVLKTITAIANNRSNSDGKLIVGIADDVKDSERIRKLDQVKPIEVNGRFVVGVNREAKVINKTKEEYFGLIRSRISTSVISEPLRSGVLSKIDYNEYFGLGVIVITIPRQSEASYYGDEIYQREGDQTVKANSAKEVGAIVSRFK